MSRETIRQRLIRIRLIGCTYSQNHEDDPDWEDNEDKYFCGDLNCMRALCPSCGFRHDGLRYCWEHRRR